MSKLKTKIIKGWAVVSKQFPYIVYCVVPHDCQYGGKRNAVVKIVKKMVKIETKLRPCEIKLTKKPK